MLQINSMYVNRPAEKMTTTQIQMETVFLNLGPFQDIFVYKREKWISVWMFP